MYSQEEIKNAFDKVCDPNDWRNPIKKTIQRGSIELHLLSESIIHFTGAVPTIKPIGKNEYLIEAEGCRMGPCGP